MCFLLAFIFLCMFLVLIVQTCYAHKKFKKLGDAHLLLKMLMFALVSHVLLVIHMKSSTLQVGPFSTCNKKHSQTLFFFALIL